MKLTTTLEQNQNKLQDIRENGILDCYELGFRTFEETILVSRKYPVFIAGEPHHGKSTFLFELLLQLSEVHGLKHFCYFGEEGDPQEIYAQLCSMFIGKSYSKIYGNGKRVLNPMSEVDLREAQIFINTHFFILPVSESITVDEFYKELEDSQRAFDIKYDCAVLDPIYDLSDFEAKEKYINSLLKKVKKECFENNRIDFIVNHTSETYTHYDRKENKKVNVPATAEQWYGGKVWNRRAFLQLLVHRPTPNEDADNYVAENQTNIIVQKAKPRGIGKISVNPLYFDIKKQRYYEQHENQIKFSHKSRNEFKEATGQLKIENIKVNPIDAFDDNNEMPF